MAVRGSTLVDSSAPAVTILPPQSKNKLCPPKFASLYPQIVLSSIVKSRKIGYSLLSKLAFWPTDLDRDRKSTRLNSSHRCISYAVFCLKKKKIKSNNDLY